ncbi:MAG: sugar ABC transporter permease [Chloroflexi bacterium]|nr:MAG: sugar ABC transporter permease [Chloroflexota bacterium]
MATQTARGQETAVTRHSTGIFTGRRGRLLREHLTAYLFLTPAALIIFTFGIFPIFYAAYVSMYKWRIRQGEFRGLANFIRAMGDVAYVFFAIIVLILLIVAINAAIKAYRTAREQAIPLRFPLLAFIPGALISYGLAEILLRFITFFSQEQAIQQGYAKILGNVPLGITLLILGFIVSHYVNNIQHKAAAKSPYSILPSFLGPATIIIVCTATAFLLARFTYQELQASERYGLALIRAALMAAGLIIFALAYILWRWAMHQHSTLKTILGILAAAAFIGGGVFFTTFWPIISKDADVDFYRSLQVTVFFSLGTVPIQLTIALILAYLLFQDIKGKALFRVIFFIPYIAPSVATAGIFEVIFSLREGSIANRIIAFLTNGATKSLLWLKEPNPALSVLGQAFGIDIAANWNAGPSLALVVIILYGIWVFVGYNTVIFLAGLGNIPHELYEAAKIDGAGRWALFRHITLPLLSPITFLLSVLAVIGTFKAFNHIWILRDTAALGTTDTASVYFFETFFRGARFGYATSMAIILFTIILAMTIIQNRIAERRVFYG